MIAQTVTGLEQVATQSVSKNVPATSLKRESGLGHGTESMEPFLRNFINCRTQRAGKKLPDYGIDFLPQLDIVGIVEHDGERHIPQ